MGIPPFYNFGRALRCFGAALALCGLTVVAHAEDTPQQQAAGAPYAPPIAKLQVTGAANRFSVDADHADAQSVLKAIFNQAHAQFTTVGNVVGQVTMLLANQSLPTTLDAICTQLLIRYKIDANGIYVFERDVVAEKAAITHIQDLNVQLRQQLRSLGLNLPEDAQLDGAQFGFQNNAPGVAGPGGGQEPGGRSRGGFGGSGGGQTFSRAGENRLGGADNNQAGRRAQTAPGAAQSKTTVPGGLEKPDLAAKDNTAVADLANGLKFLTKDDLSAILQLNPQNNALQNPDGYRAFLQQNGFVYINTGGQKAPVYEVLEELERQSNTKFLIDPSVPRGPKFSLAGYITPRTLPEALNVLTQSTRLTWRWLGTGIYVTALPDFQLFFNSTSPRVIFGSAYPTQQNGGPGQQSQYRNADAGYAPPSQTPLPITNGEKKTP